LVFTGFLEISSLFSILTQFSSIFPYFPLKFFPVFYSHFYSIFKIRPEKPSSFNLLFAIFCGNMTAF